MYTRLQISVIESKNISRTDKQVRMVVMGVKLFFSEEDIDMELLRFQKMWTFAQVSLSRRYRIRY